MRQSSQRGWVAWSLCVLLLIAGAVLGWLYWTQSQAQDRTLIQMQQQQTRLTRLEEQLEQSQEEVASQLASRQQLQRERTALENEIAALKREQTSVKDELNQLNQQQTSEQNENEQLQQQLSSRQNEIEQLTQQLDSQQNELGQLTTQLASRQNELEQLTARLASRQSELEQLTTQLASHEDDLEQQQQELTTRQDTIDQLRDELAQERDARADDVLALESALNESENVIEQLRGELNEAATTEERYLAARQQLALEQAENETYSETVERLRQEMAAETTAMEELEQRLQQQLSTLSQEKEQLVTQLEDGTTAIKLPESILFASGSADINVDGQQSLKNLAEALTSFPSHLVSVQGHTDHQTIAPRTAEIYPTNWELSSARAAAAVRELLKFGIPAEQMQAVGVADTQPLVEETSAAARQQNRRIEVILLPNQFTTRVLDE